MVPTKSTTSGKISPSLKQSKVTLKGQSVKKAPSSGKRRKRDSDEDAMQDKEPGILLKGFWIFYID